MNTEKALVAGLVATLLLCAVRGIAQPATIQIQSVGPQISTGDGRVWNLRVRTTGPHTGDVVAEEVIEK